MASRGLSCSEGREDFGTVDDTWEVDRVPSTPVWILLVNVDCWQNRI